MKKEEKSEEKKINGVPNNFQGNIFLILITVNEYITGVASHRRTTVFVLTRSSAIAGRPCDAKACQG